MIYGVPQTMRTKHSNRVKQLKLTAESAAEEIILTRIHDALESGEWDELILRLKDDSDVRCDFEPRDDD